MKNITLTPVQLQVIVKAGQIICPVYPFFSVISDDEAISYLESCIKIREQIEKTEAETKRIRAIVEEVLKEKENGRSQS